MARYRSTEPWGLRVRNLVLDVGAAVRRLTLLLFVFATSAVAQTANERPHRLGIIAPFDFASVFVVDLQRLGFSEGRNFVVDQRIGNEAQMLQHVRDAIASRPDAIVVIGSAALRAAGQATNTVPIIALGVDPTTLGLAATFRRPGANVTGVVSLFAELDGKRLDLLHQAIPRARNIGVLLRRTSQDRQVRERALRSAAATIGIDLVAFDADGPEHYEAVFEAIRAPESGIQALLITSDSNFLRDVALLAWYAIEARVPTACEAAARSGCMLAYGAAFAPMRRSAASLVVRIFQGAAPRDLPIEIPRGCPGRC